MEKLYAENIGEYYDTWAYSDGQRYHMRKFYTLEGLQMYAKRYRFKIIYII